MEAGRKSGDEAVRDDERRKESLREETAVQVQRCRIPSVQGTHRAAQSSSGRFHGGGSGGRWRGFRPRLGNPGGKGVPVGMSQGKGPGQEGTDTEARREEKMQGREKRCNVKVL